MSKFEPEVLPAMTLDELKAFQGRGAVCPRCAGSGKDPEHEGPCGQCSDPEPPFLVSLRDELSLSLLKHRTAEAKGDIYMMGYHAGRVYTLNMWIMSSKYGPKK